MQKKTPKFLHFVLSNVYIQVVALLLQEPRAGFTFAFKFREKSSVSKIKENSASMFEVTKWGVSLKLGDGVAFLWNKDQS